MAHEFMRCFESGDISVLKELADRYPDREIRYDFLCVVMGSAISFCGVYRGGTGLYDSRGNIIKCIKWVLSEGYVLTEYMIEQVCLSPYWLIEFMLESGINLSFGLDCIESRYRTDAKKYKERMCFLLDKGVKSRARHREIEYALAIHQLCARLNVPDAKIWAHEQRWINMINKLSEDDVFILARRVIDQGGSWAIYHIRKYCSVATLWSLYRVNSFHVGLISDELMARGDPVTEPEEADLGHGANLGHGADLGYGAVVV